MAIDGRQGSICLCTAQDKASYTVRSRHYVSTEAYGGPAIDTKTLAVSSLKTSPDKKKVFLALSGLEAG